MPEDPAEADKHDAVNVGLRAQDVVLIDAPAVSILEPGILADRLHVYSVHLRACEDEAYLVLSLVQDHVKKSLRPLEVVKPLAPK